MNVYFRTKGNVWLEAYEKVINILPHTETLLRVTRDKYENFTVKIASVVFTFPSNKDEIVVPWDIFKQEELFILRLNLESGSTIKYEFRRFTHRGLEIDLCESIADFFRKLKELQSVFNELSHKLLISEVEGGYLNLLVTNEKLTGHEENWMIEPIDKSLPFLAKICDNPLKHLKVEEAIRPVDVVRRTGNATLRHLASHSEHWEARTVSGLRPARLLAQVIEDDLELYENRFVKSLIDRLFIHINSKLIKIEEAINQNSNALNWEELKDEFNDFRRFEMLKYLIPGLDVDSEKLRKDKGSFMKLRQDLGRIQRGLSNCKNTWFYRALRNCQAVYSPIYPTNILLMDPNYHPLYKLWLKLEEEATKEKESALDGLLPDLQKAYIAYCQVMIIFALKIAGFEPKDGENQKVIEYVNKEDLFCFCGTYTRRDWSVRLELVKEENNPSQLDMYFRRKINTSSVVPKDIKVPERIPVNLNHIIELKNDKIEFFKKPSKSEVDEIISLMPRSYGKQREWRSKEEIKKNEEIKSQYKKWSSFIYEKTSEIPEDKEINISLCPLLIYLGQEVKEIEKNTEFLLDYAVYYSELKKYESVIVLLPTSLRFPAELSKNVIRRLVNQGDVFFKNDAEKWGNRRAGILPISQFQINSLQRIVRLINTHTLGCDIRYGSHVERCPFCDEYVDISPKVSGVYTCRKCKAIWGKNQCAECNNEFAWIRPGVKKGAQGKEGITDYSRWIETLENIAGINAITGYCEAPDEEKAKVPICPKCGNCSHAKDHATDKSIYPCPRCYKKSIT